jgi:hypothetical protein
VVVVHGVAQRLAPVVLVEAVLVLQMLEPGQRELPTRVVAVEVAIRPAALAAQAS